MNSTFKLLVATLAFCAAASSLHAEPVEVRQGEYIGAGYSFRRGSACIVVTARHVVPDIAATITVLDRSGAKVEGSRSYENEFYDLALVALPDPRTIACTTTWPDRTQPVATNLPDAKEFQAIRHYPTGRETIVRLKFAGGIKHLLNLAPVDNLHIRESDSGAIVMLDGRPAGIVQSVDSGTDRVNVLRFDTIDQLVGDRFRGASGSVGALSFEGVIWQGRVHANWTTYVQSWLTERAGRQVVASSGPGVNAAKELCSVKVDVLAWDRVLVPNPAFESLQTQLKACGKKGWLFEQLCRQARAASQSTPRQLMSQKLTINAVVQPPGVPPVSKLRSDTVVPKSGAPTTQAELELSSLQAVVGPMLKELLTRSSCQ
jgi:hypothetical protein